MPSKSVTQRQHFISQAEQRLNAANPAARSENQRIHAFDIVRRDPLVLRTVRPTGVSITGTLQFQDLFSLDVRRSERERLNFEDDFSAYEAKVGEHTERLLANLRAGRADRSLDAIELFRTKMIGVLRNPHCVTKALNTFSDFVEMADRVDTAGRWRAPLASASRPHRAAVAAKFGVAVEQYDAWLEVMVAAFAPGPVSGYSCLDYLVKLMFEDEDTEVHVVVSDYAAGGAPGGCLLSDR